MAIMIKRTDCKLEWVKPEYSPDLQQDLESLPEELKVHSQNLFRAIQETGLPTFTEASSPEQEAIWLLEVAAEIEHALLVEYLYSVYSIDSTPSTVLFRRTFTNIAVQEMGHLITVQNLLLAIGGNVYFERQDESPQSSLDPFLFKLEPLSKSVLAKYVLAEMPLISALPDAERAEIETIASENQLDISMQNRVGAIYAKIYWLFQTSDDPEGPLQIPKDAIPVDQRGKHIASLDLASASIDFQTDDSEWLASVPGLQIDLVDNRANALNAIFRISAQGEGFEGSIDSHFERFRDLYQQYDSASPTIRDVPTNPFVSATPDLDPERELNRIGHPIAKILVELADIRYKKMLLHFIQAFSYSKTGSNNELRADLMKWSLGEMTSGIRILSRQIQNLPRISSADTVSPTKAALAFTIPREVFPTSNDEQWKLLTQLLDRSQELRNELTALPDVVPGLTSLIDTEVLADDDDKRLVIAAQATDSIDLPIV
jgi:rubrerythrin